MDRLKSIFHLFLPISLGGIVSIIIKNSIDYDYLVQPLLSPPKWAFPVAWSIIYLLMGLSFYNYKKYNYTKNIDKVYYAQLIMNLLWSIIFFNLKLRLISTVWIIILDLLVFIMQKLFYRYNKTAFNLNIFYMIWMCFATYLCFSIYILN